MKIINEISERWSPVAFSNKEIDESLLKSLFEAARWAPSSFNAQPWNFIWGAKGDDMYTILYDLLSESNQVWAKTSPVLVLSVAEIIPEGRSSVNRFAMYDTGMAVANLLAQATSAGLFVHQMGGYDNKMAKEILNLPDRFEPMAMMAIGYKGEGADLEADVLIREQRKRERKLQEEFVYNRKF